MDSRRMANPAARLRGTSAVAPPFLSHSNESHMRTELIEANLRGWLEGSDVWRAVPSSRPPVLCRQTALYVFSDPVNLNPGMVVTAIP